MRVAGLAVVIASLLSAYTHAAHACTCEWNDDFTRSRAEAIFYGVVTRAERDAMCSSEDDWEDLWCPYLYTFAVEKAWKGVQSPTIQLKSWGTPCDAVFLEGRHYLVHTGAKRGPYYPAELCSPTVIGNGDRSELEKLGQPTYTPEGRH